MGVSQFEQFLDHTEDEGFDGGLRKKFGVVCSFEQNAGRMESDRTDKS